MKFLVNGNGVLLVYFGTIQEKSAWINRVGKKPPVEQTEIKEKLLSDFTLLSWMERIEKRNIYNFTS